MALQSRKNDFPTIPTICHNFARGGRMAWYSQSVQFHNRRITWKLDRTNYGGAVSIQSTRTEKSDVSRKNDRQAPLVLRSEYIAKVSSGPTIYDFCNFIDHLPHLPVLKSYMEAQFLDMFHYRESGSMAMTAAQSLLI